MKLKLSSPSKTFILGEYSAMNGGPALIACTEPRFELLLNSASSNQPKTKGIEAESPAGQFFNKFKSDFFYFDMEFFDPHQTRGGLGASSAQFAMLVALDCAVKRSHHTDFSPELLSAVSAFEAKDGFHYLQIYRDCAWQGVGLPPSGADVMAQLSGGLTYVHTEQNVISKFGWDFLDIDFILARTGKKVATHEHIKGVLDVPTEILKNITDTAMQSLLLKDEETFIESVRDYARVLQEKNWVAPHTLDLLAKINSQLPLLASKGCGALGADVLLLIFAKNEKEKIKKYLAQEKLEFVASSENLSLGLQLDIIDNNVEAKPLEAHI